VHGAAGGLARTYFCPTSLTQPEDAPGFIFATASF
jgi:hypothetical protein